ncbi:MAG: hypothetical protein J0G34_04845 [Afipia sp.]|nr:hypothetical protein [Afipia sp.]
MRQQRTIAKSRDYSGVFLAVILLGVVAVVLGLTMVAAHPASPAILAFEQSLQ